MTTAQTTGIHWVIRTAEQQANLMQVLAEFSLPYMCKVGQVQHPKTTRQIRHMHSLCNALAAHHKASPEEAKKDAKVAYGVVIVSTSIVTGDRTARLKSFADYTREEATAFCTALECHMDERGIEYIPAEGIE